MSDTFQMPEDARPVKEAFALPEDARPVKASGPSAPISTPDGLPDLPTRPVDGPVADVVFSRGRLGDIAHAFGLGQERGFGKGPIGFGKETSKQFAEWGVLYDPEKGGPPTINNALGEAFVRPAVWLIDQSLRSISGWAYGAGDALIETLAPYEDATIAGFQPVKGLGRDLAALGGAFQGSPGGLGRVEFRPGLGKDVRAGIPTEAAPDVPSVEVKPPYTYRVDNPGGEWLKHKQEDALDTPRYKKTNGSPTAFVRADNAAEVTTLPTEMLVKVPGLLDEVRIKGDPQYDALAAKVREEGWKNHSPILIKINHEGQPFIVEGNTRVAIAELEGVPNVPVEVHWMNGAEKVDGPWSPNNILPQVKTVLREEPKPLVTDLDVAAELGVIGPSRAPITEGTPREAAARLTMAAENTAGKDMVVRSDTDVSRPYMDAEGNFRIQDLKTTDEIKRVIAEVTADSDGFVEARAGNIRLAPTLERMSDITGVTAQELNDLGAGRILHNERLVDRVGTMMMQASDDFINAAQKAAMTDNLDDLLAMQEAGQRHRLITEQWFGVRAEAGRTLDAYKKFYETAPAQRDLPQFLKDQKLGTLDDLRNTAKMVKGMDRAQAAKFAQKMRKDGFMDKAIWWWANNILSGPASQMTYIVSDSIFALYDAAVITPTAGAIGAVRTAFVRSEKYTPAFRDAAESIVHPAKTGEGHGELGARLGVTENSNAFEKGYVDRKGTFHSEQAVNEVARQTEAAAMDRVFAGEGGARLHGLMMGIPDAVIAAVEALKNDVPTPPPRKLSTNKNPVTGLKPIGGAVGTFIGVPSRVLGGIHSFFDWLGYRSELHAQAYREAAKGGMDFKKGDFWNEYRGKIAFPTEASMDAAVLNGERLTFTAPLGEVGTGIQTLLDKTVVGRFVVPFLRTPSNTLKAAIEGTPLAFIDKKMRANLRGENGKVAQDTQMARLTAGSAVMAMAGYWALQGKITGDGPTNPEDRAIWLLEHQPNSIKIGPWWVAFDKFAPVGTLFGLAANLVEVGESISEGEGAAAASQLSVAASNMLLNNTGMSGLADIIRAQRDPDRYGNRYVTNFASSWMPYSSFMGQTASMFDPSVREAKTLIDALKIKVPGVRNTLLPTRDWSGVPRPNPRSGVGAVFRNVPINTDPVDLEMANLGIQPVRPRQYIGEVKLTPEQYDRYQDIAGVATRQMLNSLVSQDSWYRMPAALREKAFRDVITQARTTAAKIVQAQSVGTADDIVRQATELKVKDLTR